MSSVRWAFNFAKWEPTEKELLLAASCLQIEDKNRIDKFVYKKDAKASLIGRLMIRKFVSEYTGIPYNSIQLTTDANNKPVYNITDAKLPVVSFNVSHQGSFTVLAGEVGNKNIGVDVMKLEYTGGKTLDEFFRIMNRNFSESEWTRIKGTSQSSIQQKTSNFCRNWSLKESYLKAIGIGITTDLRKINFNITSDLQEGKLTSDTSLHIDDVKQAWIFEESLLDPFHCVAVALEQQHHNSECSNNIFKDLSPFQLLENVIPLLPEDFEYCKRYFAKDLSPQFK